MMYHIPVRLLLPLLLIKSCALTNCISDLTPSRPPATGGWIVVVAWYVKRGRTLSTHRVSKNCAFLFLSELRQISTNFYKFC